MDHESSALGAPARIDPASITADRLVDEMLEGFTADGGGVPDLERGIATFCTRLNRWLAATRTSVWLHDRRSRELVRRASSDPGADGAVERCPADRTHPLAKAMRAASAGLLDKAQGSPGVAVPLRGRRRALGTLVIEGSVLAAARQKELLGLADWVGQKLAAAVETAQLFSGVLQARRELEHTFDSIADLVAVFDRGLTVVEVNRALAARLGRPAGELREQPLREVTGEATFEWIAKAITAGGTRARVATRQFEDARWQGIFSVSVSRRLDEDGAPIGGVLVARDVTEEARLEAERSSLRERLAQAEKLAALGQFVAGIAHELNNPLQGVIGNIELVQRSRQLSTSSARDLRIAFREADRAAKIVRNLLVFAGAQPTPRRRVSLNAVISRAIAQRAAGLRAAGVEVHRERAPGTIRVRGDALLLHQAFLNIIANSEHAMAEASTKQLGVRSWVSDSGAEVITEIRDSGPGIPPEALSRIFEPFYTTKEVGQGTGLGLAVTYGIIEDHGGQIYAENRDAGAAFIVRLPVDQ